ncbi:MAG: hypothetical protein ACFBSD_10735 [Paracoccaceae bacterium]
MTFSLRPPRPEEASEAATVLLARVASVEEALEPVAGVAGSIGMPAEAMVVTLETVETWRGVHLPVRRVLWRSGGPARAAGLADPTGPEIRIAALVPPGTSPRGYVEQTYHLLYEGHRPTDALEHLKDAPLEEIFAAVTPFRPVEDLAGGVLEEFLQQSGQVAPWLLPADPETRARVRSAIGLAP